MMNMVGLTAVALVSLAIVWRGSETLEHTAEQLASYYRLPAIVQGAIIAAVGSSFPELSSTVISALLHGEFELGVSVIAGSAIFNILVIPGISGLVARSEMKTNRDIVYKETLFYIVSSTTVLITFALAAIYHPLETHEVEGAVKEGAVGLVNRPLMMIPLLLYVLYSFLQYHDSMDHEGEDPPEDMKVGKVWLMLIFSLIAILVGVEGLVRSAIGFGDYFGTPSSLWGVTVIAIGTSISDTFISVRAARSGKAVVSLANVIGSNIFDLLVAIPAGIIIAGSAAVNFSLAAPLFGFLAVATVVLFVFIRTGLTLSRIESVTLLVLYALFLFWMAAESFGLMDLIPI